MRVKLPNAPWLLCVLLAACGLFGNGEAERRAAQQAKAQADQMRAQLRELVSVTSGVIEDAGLAIAVNAPDFRTKRLSVFFRMRSIEAMQETKWRPNLVAGYVDLWALSLQIEGYFTTGDGAEVFGEQQHYAREATRATREEIESYIGRSISQEEYAQLKDAVYTFAQAHPMKGSFARLTILPSESAESDQDGVFSWIPSLGDFNPFGGVSEGIGEGAQAINDVGRVVDRFNDIVETLPRRLGWQLELVHYDIQEAQAVNDVAGGIKNIGESSGEIVSVVEALPANVRTQVEEALESIDPKLQEVRATLADVKAASGSLDTTGAQFEKTAQSLELMAAQLDTTLKTFNKTYILLDGDPDAPPPEPVPDEEKAHPFNVLEFDQTARSLTAMAAQLQTTLDTFMGVVESEQLAGRIEEVSASTESTVGSLIWTAVLGAIAIIVTFFTALFGYRRLTARA